jgi:putative nucleotidyltransferase with HDIG domain
MTASSNKTDSTKALKNIDDAFALPQVILEVLQTVDGEDTSLRDLASVVMHDPNLTAKILKMANSSYYRRGSEISTVNQAVVMIGASMVKCLALSASIFRLDGLPDINDEFDIRELYSRTIGVAVASRQIAEKAGYSDSEEAFVAGLLHDFGHLYFLRTEPDVHMSLLGEKYYSEDLTVVEREAYGMDHTQVGHAIAEKWGIPTCLRSAIGNHHNKIDANSVESLNQLDLIVILADELACRTCAARKRDLSAHLETVNILSDALKLDTEFVNDLSCRLSGEVIEAADFLGLDIGDPVDIVQRANRELFESYVTIESLFKERQELSQRILEEERRVGMMRSKNIAIATLSHYMNNAAAIILGRTQLLQMMMKSDELSDSTGKLGGALEVIETSLSKIMAVLTELKELTDLDDHEFYNDSDALNIDDVVYRRMEEMQGRYDSDPVMKT